MKEATCGNLTKLESIIILVFLTTSVFFFSTVPILAKFYIFSLLILFLLIKALSIVFLYKKNLSLNRVVLLVLLILLAYLYLNTTLAKVRFDAKVEYVNIILYVCTFLAFSIVSINQLTVKMFKISFLLISSILLMLRIINEKMIYFFVYNPNIAAGYILAVILWVIGSVKQEKEIDFLQISILCTSFLLLILLKSFSSLFIIFAMLLYSFFYTKTIAIFAIASLVIVGVVINFNSFLDRLIWSIIGVRVWFDNFLFGVGLGGFKFLYPSYLRNIGFLPNTATIYVHNFFLHLSSETGVVGLILFFCLLYTTLRKKNFTTYTYPIYGMMIQNLIDYNLLIPQNGILFFAFLGLLQQQNEELLLSKNFITICITLLLTLAGFIYSIKLQKVFTLLNSGKIEDLSKAVRLDNDCWYAWRKLSEESIKQGDIYKAKEMLTKTIITNPYDAESWFYLAVVSFKLKETQKAFRYLKTAVILQPRLAYKYTRVIKTL